MNDALTETGRIETQRYPDPTPVPTPNPVQVSVAIVEADPATSERLVSMLGGGIVAFPAIEDLGARLTGTVPVVVVLGPSCATDAVLADADALMQRFPMLAAVLMVDELTTALLQQALRAGVRDVLAMAGEADALATAIHRLAVTLDRPPTPLDVPVSPPVGTDSPEPPASSAEAAGGAAWQPSDDRGQVITVFSPKGGAGTSVVATSLAAALAQRDDRPVCLVDGDLQFGDCAVMLKLAPHHTIVDAVAALDRIDAPLLDSLLVTHEPTGLRVLPAPLEPSFADQVGAAEMVAIIEVLRSFCSYVIVDTPAYFNDVVLGLVEVSDHIAVIAGLDIPSIKNVKIGLQTLRLLNVPDDKLVMVLNRSNSKVKLDVGEVERTLGMAADVQIPSDVAVPQSVNKGEPVVTYAPRSGPAKALQQMAERFAPLAQPKKRRGR